MDFTLEQRKLIYNAVRYYQINRVPHAGKDYQNLDEILNGLFSEVIDPVPVAVPPQRPNAGFGTTTS
jgi:hypothetical protein